MTHVKHTNLFVSSFLLLGLTAFAAPAVSVLISTEN